MANRDLQLLESVREYVQQRVPGYLSETGITDTDRINHPLDKDVIEKLSVFDIREEDDDYRIFSFVNEIKDVWKLIIEKSIKCLRFFDKREPFLENQSKHPVAYGVNELSDYFEKYTQFETMLYGGGKYYRDHVVHVFRVWLLGLDCLLDNDGIYLKKINIQKGIQVNSFEKLSIWSMIALTHDLGYPLEKSQGIIEKTKDMMRSFISNPTVSMDLSFNGIQNNMNDFVVRFMSSKMHEIHEKCPKESNPDSAEKKFVARLQPKYYFKFQKSLEGYKHGILSAIIIYKLLIYFLESDFNINEDYRFDEEEARQFYIRREILRTIAAHTCHDVYHLDMLNFAFLLIMVDDAQEWGRKRISELYVKQNSNYEFGSIVPYFCTGKSVHDGQAIDIHKFIAKEEFKFPKGELENLKGILASLLRQSKGYQEIFRDGQDTAKRNFVFEKNCDVIYQESKAVTFKVEFVISNEEKPVFLVTVSSANTKSVTKTYNNEFLLKVYNNCEVNAVKINDNEVTYEVVAKDE